MFLWTRLWTFQTVLVLLTSHSDNQPSPRSSFLVPWQEWVVDLLLLFPFMILVGQGYIRMAASVKFPKSIQRMIKPAIWTTLLQGLFADVIFHFLLKSVMEGDSDTPITATTRSTGKDPISWSWWNTTTKEPLLLVFLVRFVITILGLSMGEAFFPLVLTGGIACGKSTVSKLLQEHANFTMIDTDRIGHMILLPPWHVDLNQPKALVTPKDSVYVRILETFQQKHNNNNNNSNDKKDDDDTPPQTKTETTTSNNTKKPDPHILPGVNDHHFLLDGDNNIDRVTLGAHIFANPEERRKLNAMTHPRIFTCLLKNLITQSSLLSLGYPWRKSSCVCAEIPLFFETNSIAMRYIFGGYVMVVACTESQQYQRLRHRNPELSKEACQQRIDSQLPMSIKIQKADIVFWNDKDYSTTTTTTSSTTDVDDTNTNTQDQHNQALMQQVDQAVHTIRQRMGGVMETTLSRVLLFLSGSVVILTYFQLVLGW
jgi:dephospho-CoA kinase